MSGGCLPLCVARAAGQKCRMSPLRRPGLLGGVWGRVGRLRGRAATRYSGRMDAILFDMDDTLYDQALPFARAVRRVLGEVPGATAEGLYLASRRHSGEVFAAYAAGERPTDAMYVRRMQRTMAEFGVRVDEACALRLQRAYTARDDAGMVLSPAMASALDWCLAHARCGVGVVTNGTPDRQMDKWRALGLGRWIRPERVFVSDALGVAKPDPAIFRAALSAMGARAAQSLYVGDAFQTDVVGARAAGVRVVWLNRRRRAVPGDARVRPDAEVRSDEGLLDLLRTSL